MSQDSAVRRYDPAQGGKYLNRDAFAVHNGRVFDPSKQGTLFCLMALDELAHLINRVNAVEITFVLCHPPSEEAVTSQEQALNTGIFLYGSFDQQSQFESRTLPWYPDDLAIKFLIELFQLALTVGTGGHRDRPVGVEMIDVQKRQKCMQGSVDRGGYTVLSKCRQRIVADHLVFILLATIELLQLFETIETKKALDDTIKADMNKALKEFKERFVHEREAATAAAAR